MVQIKLKPKEQMFHFGRREFVSSRNRMRSTRKIKRISRVTHHRIELKHVDPKNIKTSIDDSLGRMGYAMFAGFGILVAAIPIVGVIEYLYHLKSGGDEKSS